ncbi:hypothetical protein SEA_DALANDE_90 [Gordonia phage DalanDe]|nr:hypothetical protein SEA_DALANDE_90 [Gordonia phage DalanDe]
MTVGVQLQLDLGMPPTPAELRKAAANEWAHDVWVEDGKEVPYGASVLCRLRSRTVPQLRRMISQDRNHTLEPSLKAEIRRVTRGYSSEYKHDLVDLVLLVRWVKKQRPDL